MVEERTRFLDLCLLHSDWSMERIWTLVTPDRAAGIACILSIVSPNSNHTTIPYARH